ncbi:hypothetical protein CEXT_627171 [Caerostris extrusa]|uniref:Uncharacterized protein n=1 Tax=Caerostris extrusa TaxID=172846 RepID=A0AAV4X1B6_CAEEX|nr:hypothetical protein CEXT_627171 [Caerostris extrusa]
MEEEIIHEKFPETGSIAESWVCRLQNTSQQDDPARNGIRRLVVGILFTGFGFLKLSNGLDTYSKREGVSRDRGGKKSSTENSTKEKAGWDRDNYHRQFVVTENYQEDDQRRNMSAYLDFEGLGFNPENYQDSTKSNILALKQNIFCVYAVLPVAQT